jgi:uncharacterized membrane protein
MRDPDRVRVPDVVPDGWVASYRDELRARRQAQLAREVTRLADSSRRDSSALLAAGGFCGLMLLVALVTVRGGAPGRSAVLALGVVAAFGTCLWLVHRCTAGSGSER